MRKQQFDLIENYIYIYQLDKYVIIAIIIVQGVCLWFLVQ